MQSSTEVQVKYERVMDLNMGGTQDSTRKVFLVTDMYLHSKYHSYNHLNKTKETFIKLIYLEHSVSC